MKRFIFGTLALASLLIASGTAHAQYGAIAYDADSRHYGHSYNQGSPREAERVALSYCRSGGCQVVVHTGPSQCGAVAAARRSTRYHWSTRPHRREAEFAAIEGCERESGGACELMVWQCND